MTASQLTLELLNNGQQINQQMQSINHPTFHPFNLQSNNHFSNLINNTPHSSIQNQPIQSSIQKTNEIYQQIKMNIDIEKVYLSKAKLMLNLKRTNDTLITNLSDDERNLLLKALDTSKLDYAIKHLTNLIHITTNIDYRNSSLDLQSNLQNNLTTQIEFINRPLTSSKNLIDQLQLLLGTNINDKKWNLNDTVDYYSNLNQNNINFPIIQDENLDGSSSLLDDDLDSQFNDEINFF